MKTWRVGSDMRWRRELSERSAFAFVHNQAGGIQSTMGVAEVPLLEQDPVRSRIMQKRRRFKQQKTLEERLRLDADLLRKQAATFAPGPKRDDLIRKAAQADEAAGMSVGCAPRVSLHTRRRRIILNNF